jgi:hypothetical protein
MAQKYAKDQPADFANRIERVAIVGVSQISSPPSTQPLIYSRLEVMSANALLKLSSKPANTL